MTSQPSIDGENRVTLHEFQMAPKQELKTTECELTCPDTVKAN